MLNSVLKDAIKKRDETLSILKGPKFEQIVKQAKSNWIYFSPTKQDVVVAGIDSSFNSTKFQGAELWAVTAVSVKSDGEILVDLHEHGLDSNPELASLASKMEIDACQESVDKADLVLMDGALYSQFLTRQKPLANSLVNTITKNNKKPILVLKSGRSPEGAKAAMSHTGALMGSDEIYDAVIKQSGAIRVDTMEELFDYATAFSKQPLPTEGDLVIVSNAGGPAIISTDSCSKLGIKMAKIEEIRPKIDAVIPPWGSSRNPVDIVGDADFNRFENVLNEVLAHKNVGSVISMCTPSATLDYDKLAEVIVKMSKKYKKTMLASLMGLDEGITNREILANGDVPYYTYAEGSIRTLKAMLRFVEWIKTPEGNITKFEADREKVKKIFDKVKQEGRTNLLEEEGLEILNTYGFPLPKNILAKTEDEAVEAANKIGYSVVMKIASPQIVHKSDAGGVKVNLTNDEEVRSAFKEIVGNAKKYDSNAEIKGVLIVEMVKGGKEMIIGSKLEPGFGPVLMLGMGGIYVEILKDVTFRLAPVTDQEANDMISSIKTKKLLEGVRGEKPSDVEKLSECIQRLSQLVTDFKEIKELDMNPVLVMEKGEGCKILDVRIGI